MPIPRGYNAYNFMAQIKKIMGIGEGQNAYINFPAKTKDAVYSIENNDSGEKRNVMQWKGQISIHKWYQIYTQWVLQMRDFPLFDPKFQEKVYLSILLREIY